VSHLPGEYLNTSDGLERNKEHPFNACAVPIILDLIIGDRAHIIPQCSLRLPCSTFTTVTKRRSLLRSYLLLGQSKISPHVTKPALSSAQEPTTIGPNPQARKNPIQDFPRYIVILILSTLRPSNTFPREIRQRTKTPGRRNPNVQGCWRKVFCTQFSGKQRFETIHAQNANLRLATTSSTISKRVTEIIHVLFVLFLPTITHASPLITMYVPPASTLKNSTFYLENCSFFVCWIVLKKLYFSRQLQITGLRRLAPGFIRSVRIIASSLPVSSHLYVCQHVSAQRPLNGLLSFMKRCRENPY
jgi:hypothetical protein